MVGWLFATNHCALGLMTGSAAHASCHHCAPAQKAPAGEGVRECCKDLSGVVCPAAYVVKPAPRAAAPSSFRPRWWSAGRLVPGSGAKARRIPVRRGWSWFARDGLAAGFAGERSPGSSDNGFAPAREQGCGPLSILPFRRAARADLARGAGAARRACSFTPHMTQLTQTKTNQ